MLFLIAQSNVYSQGEYFKDGETGITFGRVIAISHGIQANGIGVGFSYCGRIDFSMVQDDRNTLFDDVNSYSITGHLIKQEFFESGGFPFSLALSMSHSNADIRTYSVTPYVTFQLENKIDLIVHAGVSLSRQLSNIFSTDYLKSYPLGIALLGNLTDHAALGIESGVIVSKVYPGYGIDIFAALEL